MEVSEASPRPWRITHPGEIEDANGDILYNLRDCIGGGVDEANAALIVDAVNHIEETKRLSIKLYDPIKRAEAERDRLRDLVKRLADRLETESERPYMVEALIREARAAIGEGEK